MDHHHHHLTTPNPPPLVAASSWPLFRNPMEATATTEGELRESLLRATLDLETTRAAAQEELQRMEGHALRLARFLEVATRERDEARLQCHSLLLLLMNCQHHHHHHLPTIPPPVTVHDVNNVVVPSSSSSSSEENESSVLSSAEIEAIAERRGLPEKGRLVEAVMGAGPLLQTLLLAGQLPQWRHPPPTLQSFEIPPALTMFTDGSKREMREMEFCSGQMYHPSPSLPSPPWSMNNNSSLKYEGINQPN